MPPDQHVHKTPFDAPEYRRRYNRARKQAYDLLRGAHPEEFDRLFAAELRRVRLDECRVRGQVSA